jgi:curved DNA-binding protein CbpA
MKADFYDVLGVSKDADFDAIRSAHKSAAKRSHPDRGGTAEEFESVRRAYECLCDPAQREAYDRTRSSGEKKKADEADAKALEKLRTTIIGVVSFLSEKPAKSGGALSEPAQFAMLADGSFLDTLAWQFRKWMADARESKRKLECEAAKYRLLKEMVAPVAGKPNRLHPLLQSAEEDFGKRGSAIAEVIEVFERALEIVHDHQFKLPQALNSEPAGEADEWEGFEPDVPTRA